MAFSRVIRHFFPIAIIHEIGYYPYKMKKLLCLILAAALLTFGLVLLSCDSTACPGNGDCNINALTSEIKYCYEGQTNKATVDRVTQCAVYKESVRFSANPTIELKNEECDC